MAQGSGRSLKLEGAKFAITVDASRRVIEDATVIVDRQRIKRVGKTNDLRDVAADRTIDAAGGVLTPAFVNGHMHISYAHAVRGQFADDFVGRERLREVFRLQSAMTEEEEYYTSLLGIVELPILPLLHVESLVVEQQPVPIFACAELIVGPVVIHGT